MYIWLGLSSDAPWHWRNSGDTGVAYTMAEKSSLAGLDFRDLTFIIPGQWTGIRTVSLPDIPARDRLKAAGFSVEDSLGQSLDHQHLVMCSEGKRLALITLDKMKYILDEASKYNLSPDFIYADFDVLSQYPAPILLKDRYIIPSEGLTHDPGWISMPKKAQNETDILSLLRQINTENAINLRTGDFQKRRNWSAIGLNVSKRQMGIFAVLLSLVSVSYLGQTMTKARALNHQTAMLETRSNNIYETAMGKPAPADPARDMLRQLKTKPNSNQNVSQNIAGLMSILTRVDGVMIETLQYNSDEDGLVIRFIYPNFEASSALEQQAIASKFRVEAGGVREQGGRLVGDVRFVRQAP